MPKRIVGVFSDRDNAQRAVHALFQQGIATERISVVVGGAHGAAAERSEVGTGEAAAGVAAGAGLALLTGLTTIALPGIGLALSAAPLAAAISVAANGDERDVTGSVRLTRILTSAEFTDDQARAFGQDLRLGRTLVGVRAEDEQSQMVSATLRRYGGINLDVQRAD